MTDHKNNLTSTFRIDFSSEIPNIHPANFCLKCYSTMKNIEKKKVTTHSIDLVEWKPHDENCSVCTKFSYSLKGGRPKKKKAASGRTKLGTTSWSRSMSDFLHAAISPETRTLLPNVL